MTHIESKAFTVIKKLKQKKRLKNLAAVVITKSAKLHLKIKHNHCIFKHEIIDLGECIEQFQIQRRIEVNIKDIGQNRVDEILKEFTKVQKTNDEMMIYMSSLASMVEKLKGEKEELEIKYERSYPITIDDNKDSENNQNIQKILIGMSDNRDLKNLKKQLILKDYVIFFILTIQSNSLLEI